MSFFAYVGKHRHFEYGFTLLELIVVFSLIAVISGVGVASFVSYGQRQAIAEGQTDVKLAIEKARNNAISAVKPASCTDNDPLTSYKFVLCDNGGNCVESENDYEIDAVCGSQSVVVQRGQFKPGIVVDTTNTTCSEIEFDSLTGSVLAGNPSCAVVLMPGQDDDTSGGRPDVTCGSYCEGASDCSTAIDSCTICNTDLNQCEAPPPPVTGACGTFCTRSSDCTIDADACTVCQSGLCVEDEPEPSGACGSSCANSSECTVDADVCTECVSGVCAQPPTSGACYESCNSNPDCSGPTGDWCGVCNTTTQECVYKLPPANNYYWQWDRGDPLAPAQITTCFRRDTGASRLIFSGSCIASIENTVKWENNQSGEGDLIRGCWYVAGNGAYQITIVPSTQSCPAPYVYELLWYSGTGEGEQIAMCRPYSGWTPYKLSLCS